MDEDLARRFRGKARFRPGPDVLVVGRTGPGPAVVVRKVLRVVVLAACLGVMAASAFLLQRPEWSVGHALIGSATSPNAREPPDRSP